MPAGAQSELRALVPARGAEVSAAVESALPELRKLLVLPEGTLRRNPARRYESVREEDDSAAAQLILPGAPELEVPVVGSRVPESLGRVSLEMEAAVAVADR